MKHVFVETNFLVSLLRPFPAQDALDIFARNDGVNLRLLETRGHLRQARTHRSRLPRAGWQVVGVPRKGPEA